jgi:hypothetical protein
MIAADQLIDLPVRNDARPEMYDATRSVTFCPV